MNNNKSAKSDLQMPDQAFRSALRNFAGQKGAAKVDAEFSEELGAGSESSVAQWVNKNLGRQPNNK
ncbi:hypothetical protein [Paenibacillus sp. SN-8-1]|uniref:hypothetical protein n=1 Tax=Paenibacillus sp. SN-8-1 TaxID=3435409 RepID=UPI003D9A5EFA